MTKANFCSECGEPLVHDANFCAICGAAVRNAASDSEESQLHGDTSARDEWTRFVGQFTSFVDRALVPFKDLGGLGDFLEPDGPELSYCASRGPARPDGLSGTLDVEFLLDPLRVKLRQSLDPLIAGENFYELAETLTTPLVEVEWDEINQVFACSATIPVAALEESLPWDIVITGVTRVWRCLLPEIMLNLEDDLDRKAWPRDYLRRVPDADDDPKALTYATELTGAPTLPLGLPQGTRASLRAWSDAGLGTPFIPVAFAESLAATPEWQWSSLLLNDNDPLLSHEQTEMLVKGDLYRPPRAEDSSYPHQRFVVANSGYGMNSYVLTYLIDAHRLFASVQRPFGGAFMNRWETRADVIRASGNLSYLETLLSEVPDFGGRLVVEDATWGMQRVGLQRPPDAVEEILGGEEAVAQGGSLEASIRLLERVWLDGLREGLDTSKLSPSGS